MLSDRRLFALLEEALTTERTVEDICVDCPELLRELRLEVQSCRELDGRLDELFPSSDGPPPGDMASPDIPQIDGYRIIRVLGRGGLGIVYQAHHLKLDRSVALKMLLAGNYVGAGELSRLLREARVIAAMQHPNIVQVYDVGDTGGRQFFTMEFVDHGTLSQRLRDRPMTARDAAEVSITLAEATQAAHRAGIVHRDLKPGNILLAADGTPKISDFGLARQHLDEQASLSTWAQVGTPSYMAPEQVRGLPDAGSPLVDVYALGAVLYEMLTGRPPFVGETNARTYELVLAVDPVAPSELNRLIPRDLETICLKCLSKSPLKRYQSAAFLAADLQRFLSGEPIWARPVGSIERVIKWTRRRPALATAISVSLLLLIAGTIGLTRLMKLQKERRQAVEADLAEVKSMEDSAQWLNAKGAVERAAAQLGAHGPASLVAELDQAGRNLNLLIRLDAIHLSRVTSGQLDFYREKADQDYRAAFFAAFSLGVGDPIAVAASKVNTSRVRPQLAVAIDDWAVAASDPADRRWLLELGKRCQPDADHSSGDQSSWGDRIRDADHWTAPTEVAELISHVPVDRVPISALLLLSERLRKAGTSSSSDFLRRVQRSHPDDFWVNLQLGTTVLWQNPAEAEGFCRAALASRPWAAVSYNSLADALRGEGHPYDAIATYQKALVLDSGYARARTNLGTALADVGRFSQSMSSFDAALQIDPKYVWANFNAAETLMQMHRFDDAAARYKRVAASKLNDIQVQRGWQTALLVGGHPDQALASCRDSITADPTKYETSAGYAQMCLFLNRDSEYESARISLLQQFGSTNSSANVQAIALSCLLSPASDDVLRQINDFLHKHPVARSSKPDWVYRRYIFNQGLLAYRQREPNRSIALLSGLKADTLGPCPEIVLAMAQADAGQLQQARQTFATAVLRYDWRTSNISRMDMGEYHVLRREAEAKLEPNLSAFLSGKYAPEDNLDRIAFLGASTERNLNQASAQLYADAFAADHSLEDQVSLTIRFQAACAAVKAGGAHWQTQALEWLSNDLAFKMSHITQGDAQGKARLEHELGRWQTDPDLHDGNDPAALDRLTPAEHRAWGALWRDVEAEMKRLESSN